MSLRIVIYDCLMGYSVVLFDLDYTLFDSALSERDALQKSLDKISINLTEELLVEYQKINKRLWADLERNKISLERLRVQRFEIFLGDLGSDQQPLALADTYTHNLGLCGSLLPGARKLLSELIGKFKIALVTNGVSETQRHRIEKFDIEKYFDAIVISGEFGSAKPNSPIFAETLRLLNHDSKDEVLMIGDSLSSDIAGAADFNIDSCWFNPDSKPLTGIAKPTFIAQSFNDVWEVIRYDSNLFISEL